MQPGAPHLCGCSIHWCCAAAADAASSRHRGRRVHVLRQLLLVRLGDGRHVRQRLLVRLRNGRQRLLLRLRDGRHAGHLHQLLAPMLLRQLLLLHRMLLLLRRRQRQPRDPDLHAAGRRAEPQRGHILCEIQSPFASQQLTSDTTSLANISQSHLHAGSLLTGAGTRRCGRSVARNQGIELRRRHGLHNSTALCHQVGAPTAVACGINALRCASQNAR